MLQGMFESVVTVIGGAGLTLDGITLGVLELGFFQSIETRARELFEIIGESVALAVRSTQSGTRTR